MRTNIVLDDALVAAAMVETGIKTKRELVDFALRELLARRTKKDLLELAGLFADDPGYTLEHLRGDVRRFDL